MTIRPHEREKYYAETRYRLDARVDVKISMYDQEPMAYAMALDQRMIDDLAEYGRAVRAMKEADRALRDTPTDSKEHAFAEANLHMAASKLNHAEQQRRRVTDNIGNNIAWAFANFLAKEEE